MIQIIRVLLALPLLVFIVPPLKNNNVVNLSEVEIQEIKSLYSDMGLYEDYTDVIISVDVESEPFSSVQTTSNEVPAFTSQVVQEGKNKITNHYYKNKVVNGEIVKRDLISSTCIQEGQDEIIAEGFGNPRSFTGTLTGYYADCLGCTGILYHPVKYKNGTREWKYVDADNIYYDYEQDKIVSELCETCYYIVAADKKIPGGTVVDITLVPNSSISKKQIRAVVMDIGSAIQGKTMDLLFKKEDLTFYHGRLHNIKFYIVRWGW